MINGQQVRVVNPNTNEFLDPSTTIDTEVLDFATKSYYIRALQAGDLVEAVVSANTQIK
jgi:hypothetical protein